VLVASVDLHKIWARCAGNNGFAGEACRIGESTVVTVNGFHIHDTRTRMGPGTTRVRTTAPGTPRINFAMNRTRTVVAVDKLPRVGAGDTTMKRRSERTTAGVLASTTRHAASGTGVVVLNTP
jgi:hypothetical protein